MPTLLIARSVVSGPELFAVLVSHGFVSRGRVTVDSVFGRGRGRSER